MIGQLHGTLIAKQAPSLMLDVHGVGYEIEAPMTTFYRLPELGQEVTLFTHLVVREDAHLLFGFATRNERRLFRDLIRVNGVGARLALAILSGMSVSEFASCIHQGDAALLTRLPGIGKKTAERLIVEMRDRLGAADTALAGQLPAQPNGQETQVSAAADAVSALQALGYKHQEALRMVRGIESAGLGSNEIIRQALQRVVK